MAYKLRAKEIAKALDISTRRVATLIKRGMPCKKQGVGRPTLYDLKKCKKWYADNVLNVDGIAKHNDEKVPDFKLLSGKAAEANSDLYDLVKRVRLMEMSSHKQLVDAIKSKSGKPVVASLQATWNRNVTELTKVEKIMPAILFQRGEYGSITEMTKALIGSYTQTSTILDQIGSMVAEKCVGKEALEIKNNIDQGVADAKRALLDGINKFINK